MPGLPRRLANLSNHRRVSIGTLILKVAVADMCEMQEMFSRSQATEILFKFSVAAVSVSAEFVFSSTVIDRRYNHSRTTTPSSLRAFFSKVTNWQFFALENP